MASIKQLLHIKAPKQKVFEAISTIKGLSKWWTAQTTGKSEEDRIIKFRFNEHGPDMKVTKLSPAAFVEWECVGGIEDWIGTILTFDLDENDGKTRIRFEHSNWKESGDFFASCSFTWGRYLESLRQYCQTGKGGAFGSEEYKI